MDRARHLNHSSFEIPLYGRVFITLAIALASQLSFAFGAAITPAGSFWGKSSTKLGFSILNYSGEKTKSLGGKKGFGGEVITERGRKTFSLLGKVRGEYSATSAYFDDGGTERSLNYELIHGEAAVGFKVGLFPGSMITPYITGAGLVGFASLSFTSTSLAELKNSEKALSLGYEVGAGIEMEFKRNKGQKFLLWGEIQSRTSSAKLAGQSQFGLDALRMALGVGW